MTYMQSSIVLLYMLGMELGGGVLREARERQIHLV